MVSLEQGGVLSSTKVCIISDWLAMFWIFEFSCNIYGYVFNLQTCKVTQVLKELWHLRSFLWYILIDVNFIFAFHICYEYGFMA